MLYKSRIRELTGQDLLWFLIALLLIAFIAFYIRSENQAEHLKEYTRIGMLAEQLTKLLDIKKRLGVNGETTEEIKEANDQLEEVKKQVGRLSPKEVMEKIQNLAKVINDLERRLDKPPLITLTEANGFTFPSGKAEISYRFREILLGKVADKVAECVEKYAVDVVEIVGHTDEAKTGGKSSNLDSILIPYLDGDGVEFVAGSNVDLGMSRAAAVAQVLKGDSRLAKLRIIPLSAGQIVTTSGMISTGVYEQNKNDEGRRRIEIRLKRSKYD